MSAPCSFVFREILGIALAALCFTKPISAAERDVSGAVLVQAAKEYGDEGRRDVEFLMTYAPAVDKAALPASFFINDLSLALDARQRFPWARKVPEDIFLNDVLPYASVDETREPWRREMLDLAAPLVRNCQTATEAVQTLNRDLFKKLNVRYSTQRQIANQSPSQTMASGLASCTGLSILLVDACRSVGIPARLAGFSRWNDKPGNHTWVEFWDGGWHFVGAAEYAADGVDPTWFSDEIAHGSEVQAIWAASWKTTGVLFPTAWSEGPSDVPGVIVTSNYKQPISTSGGKVRRVLLFDQPDGKRLDVPIEWISAEGRVLSSSRTKGEEADRNEMAELTAAAPGPDTFLRAFYGGQWREWPVDLSGREDQVLKLAWSHGARSERAIPLITKWLAQPAASRGPAPDLSLTKREAEQIGDMLWAERRAQVAADEKDEMASKEIRYQDKKMPWLERTFGEAPPTGRSLWISLHGGGGAPASLNDEQWHNQITLYEPAEGIVVAPRAPTNSWDLWHQDHIDPMFDQLIAGMVATRGVDPNHVYIMGYSAGGDGVYQLAPRMADRWAAAAMMAGHPNDARPEGLRDLPFFIFVGGADAAYGRNKVAAQWDAKLNALAASDPGGYQHKTTIFPGLPHWMNHLDAEALPWMAAFARDPWPRVVVWVQNGVTHDRFYWLAIPPPSATKDQMIRASIQGQVITLTSDNMHRIILRLSDHLLDLDRPVIVKAGGKTVFSGFVPREANALYQSLEERADPDSMASALLPLHW